MEPTRLRSGQCPTESIWRKQIPIAEWWSWMKIPAECLPLQTCLLHRQLHLIPPRNHRQQSTRIIHPAVRQRTPAPHQVQSCAASDSESSSSSEDYQPPAVSNNTYFEDTKPSSDWQKWLCTIIWPPWYWSQEKSTPACLPNETAVGGHGTRNDNLECLGWTMGTLSE